MGVGEGTPQGKILGLWNRGLSLLRDCGYRDCDDEGRDGGRANIDELFDGKFIDELFKDELFDDKLFGGKDICASRKRGFRDNIDGDDLPIEALGRRIDKDYDALGDTKAVGGRIRNDFRDAIGGFGDGGFICATIIGDIDRMRASYDIVANALGNGDGNDAIEGIGAYESFSERVDVRKRLGAYNRISIDRCIGARDYGRRRYRCS